jgi:hypothetical protein
MDLGAEVQGNPYSLLASFLGRLEKALEVNGQDESFDLTRPAPNLSVVDGILLM